MGRLGPLQMCNMYTRSLAPVKNHGILDLFPPAISVYVYMTHMYTYELGITIHEIGRKRGLQNDYC